MFLLCFHDALLGPILSNWIEIHVSHANKWNFNYKKKPTQTNKPECKKGYMDIILHTHDVALI